MIVEQERLNALAARLQAAEWIALDTEADSLHAYPEKICLLQVSSPAGDELVDPLANLDLSPFLAALGGRELILHGSDYDLRLLKRTYNFKPARVFDTMLAARLLGYPQFGLTNLVEKKIGIALEKGPQKMNWARRPLTERMLHYARNDTRHLKPVADMLRAELVEKGRLSWLEEFCARLIEDCSAVRESDREDDWKLKGSDRLGRSQLAVLREIWHWREEEAIQANTPPYFILSHETAVEIARDAATVGEAEARIPGRFSQRRRRSLLAAVEKGLALPPNEWPTLRKSTFNHPTMAEQRRFNLLKEKRDRVALELQIDPTLIASRGGLVVLAKDWEIHSADLMKWQKEALS